MHSTLERIAGKLSTLRRLDSALQVYGASMHGYRLNPVLSEPEVVAFEKCVGVTIPEEYRTYLLEFANGGAGPDNGVHPLTINWDTTGFPLDVPFPIATKTAREVISRPREKRSLEAFDSYPPGCMELSDGGCGIVSLLIFSGEQRGIIWYSGACCELYPSVSKNECEQIGFFRWYEEWLDERLAPEVIGNWRRLIL